MKKAHLSKPYYKLLFVPKKNKILAVVDPTAWKMNLSYDYLLLPFAKRVSYQMTSCELIATDSLTFRREMTMSVREKMHQ